VSARGRVLIVDDEASLCDLVVDHLRRDGFEASAHRRAEAALEELPERELDVVLTDLRMPGMSGAELCERIVASRPDVPVVVMTAFGSMETAVAALRAGAHDFVTKPIELEVLSLVLDRAVRFRALQHQVKVLTREAEASRRFSGLVGESPAMRRLFSQLDRVADSEAPVLILGESGSGKELVARALHQRSRRENGPFVAINCAALPEALVESELFGHARGAFTDARTARNGLLREADGGTLLLDEIGDLPLPLQPKLLRALEEGRFRPVGSDREVTFDVRVVAATHRDLEQAVEEGRFREDLYFRINVVRIEVPPLRTRGTDVLLLAQRFLKRSASRAEKQVTGISDAAARKLMEYRWPGNVRELRNAIAHAVALTAYDTIAPEDLPQKIGAERPSRMFLGAEDPAGLVPLEEVERRYVHHVLEATAGNRTAAAKILGLDRKTLYRKLQRYRQDADAD
jgi:DNA-binding NtrC family response regulator